MKNLVFLSGPMGVGKTSVCRHLLKELAPAAFLDGDWCWTMEPLIVNEETKAMVQRSIAYLLKEFLSCSVYETVIFCWVMHQQEIADTLLEALEGCKFRLTHITLTAAPESLVARLQADISAGIRSEDVIERSLAYLPLYDRVSSHKLDTSSLSALEAARLIAQKLR